MKNEQRERRKAEGDNRVYAQMDDNSSFSSSDEEDLNVRAGNPPNPGRLHQKIHDKVEQLKQLKSDSLRHEQRVGEDGMSANGLGGNDSTMQEPIENSLGVVPDNQKREPLPS